MTHSRQCVCEICTCSQHHCPPISTNASSFSPKPLEKPVIRRERATSNPLSMGEKTEWESEAKGRLRGVQGEGRGSLLPAGDGPRPTQRAVIPFQGLSEARAQFTPKESAYAGRAGARGNGFGFADGASGFAASSAEWTTESKAVYKGQKGDRATLNLEGFGGAPPRSSRVSSKFDGQSEAQREYVDRGAAARAERVNRPANPLFGGADGKGQVGEMTSESRSAFVDKGVIRTRPEWDGMPLTKRTPCPAIKIVPVGDRKRSIDGHVRFNRSASGMNWV